MVNVASHSEQTVANYRSLQELHRELGTSHFNVLAFPCGQFGDTERGLGRDIEVFAQATYGVTFPFFDKIRVMGTESEPAFKFLTGWKKEEGNSCVLKNISIPAPSEFEDVLVIWLMIGVRLYIFQM